MSRNSANGRVDRVQEQLIDNIAVPTDEDSERDAESTLLAFDMEDIVNYNFKLSFFIDVHINRKIESRQRSI